MTGLNKKLFRNKELSWLTFNARVLQEASDPNVPLVERIRFLGIFSNNLDEFFRIRVAGLNRLVKFGREAENLIGHNPKRIIKEIQETVVRQHQQFDQIFHDLSLALARHNIFIINEQELEPDQGAYVREYFHREVRQHLIPLMIDQVKVMPTLRDQSVYLAVVLSKSRDAKQRNHALIEIPGDLTPRLVELPRDGKHRFIILLDDIMRYCLDEIFAGFGYRHFEAYAVKITRDAELDFEDDVTQSLPKRIARSLKQRKQGTPTRFVHDAHLPKEFFGILTSKLKLTRDDTVIAGARYHNFRDFMSFPDFGIKAFRYEKFEVLQHPALRGNGRLFDVIRKRDILLHYPHQSFSSVIDFLREAAIDPDVSSIRLTVYRTARNSSVMNALINAARNGKSVTVVIELQARFDEEHNLYWGNKLQEEGVRVIYGVPGLKVHSKICLVNRREKGRKVRYAIVGTGNFNEQTARVYDDLALFTANPKITEEVRRVFRFYENNYNVTPFRHLVVSPFNMRRRMVRLIQNEIKNAKTGKPAFISLKLNNLVDQEMVSLLYEASQAGVEVKLIVRAMFSLVPGLPDISDRIQAIGIVDRYLEHSRVFIFCNGGRPLYFISSADLMTRNLDHRVEVTCPIFDKSIQAELQAYIDIQWSDNVKARVLNEHPDNLIRRTSTDRKVRAQYAVYEHLRNQLEAETEPPAEQPEEPVEVAAVEERQA